MDLNLKGLSIEDRKLVIGIDFGTTFSGVCFAETRRSDHHTPIEQWPSRLGTNEGMSSVKIPTELRYTNHGTEWGFQIPSRVERYQWFKLGLAEKNPTSGGSSQLKTPEQLTTDFLSELYKHTMYTLEQKLGAAILRTVPLEFCLTVPAIWSEVAKERTLEACRKAGMKSASDIMIVSEPEAAAIYALHGLDPHGLNLGDSFVLCDAGGGTVELISYTITALHPILQVKEAAGGTGGKCGATFLNRAFGEFLTTKLGGEDGWEDDILVDAMERFEAVIKKQYTPASANEDGYTIQVPGLANNQRLGIRRGRYTLQPRDLHGIFEPIIAQIIELVKGQIRSSDKNIKAVLLVGGFGQNTYLKERLRGAVGDIPVLQPPNAWSAIMRGAVMMGLSRADPKLAAVDVTSRKARKHYGTELAVKYDSSLHSSSKKFWSAKDKYDKVNVMFWFVRKGDTVDQNKPSKIDFTFEFLVSNGLPKSGSLTVYADADSSSAPVHKGSSVANLAVLEAHFSHFTESDLASTIETGHDGKKYYCLAGCIEAAFYSASTKYSLLFLGKRYDTVTAEYA